MDTTRLSSKGQMIVPKSIREELALKPGAELEVELINRQSFKVEVKRKLSHAEQVERLAGSLKRPGRHKPMTVADMDAAIVKAVREADERTRTRRRRRS